MSDLKSTIAIMTSGGDAPGMNAVIQGAYASAVEHGYELLGIYNGYTGLINNEIKPLDISAVKKYAGHGGTILGTSRCPEFKEEAVQKKAAEICRQHNIKAIIIAGGDGSFQGALKLAQQGIGVIGIPATIDLDIDCTDYTLGFDTAVNAAMEAIDRIKDTSESHSCCTVVEVMGRNAGYIAMWTGITNAADAFLIPETLDEKAMMESLSEKKLEGGIVVVAEGAGKAADIAPKIEKLFHIHTRSDVLGFIQRGGNPTCQDRLYGNMMGSYAVDLISENKLCHIVTVKDGKLSSVEIKEGLSEKKVFPEYVYHLNQIIQKI